MGFHFCDQVNQEEFLTEATSSGPIQWVTDGGQTVWEPLMTKCSFFPLQVIENCAVTGIRVRTDDFGVQRVAAVETEHGSIQTPCVVNCAGCSSDSLSLGPTHKGHLSGVECQSRQEF